jgi:hypothetical protein
MGSFPSRRVNAMNRNNSKNVPSEEFNKTEMIQGLKNVSKDPSSNIKKLELFFQYFEKLSLPEVILNDPICFDILTYMNELTYTGILRICAWKIDPLSKYKFHEIMAKFRRSFITNFTMPTEQSSCSNT